MDIKPKYITLSLEQYEHMVDRMEDNPNMTEKLKQALSSILSHLAAERSLDYAIKAGEIVRSKGIKISPSENQMSDEDRFNFNI